MKPSERRELKQRQQEMREAAEREAEQERLREQQNTASEDGHCIKIYEIFSEGAS